MYDYICININKYDVALILFSYNDLKRLDKNVFPNCYIPIANDFEFEGFILSLRKEDFGHIYYFELESYQRYVLEQNGDETKIEAVNKHNIHIANGFTEFTQKLYIIPDEDS